MNPMICSESFRLDYVRLGRCYLGKCKALPRGNRTQAAGSEQKPGMWGSVGTWAAKGPGDRRELLVRDSGPAVSADRVRDP